MGLRDLASYAGAVASELRAAAASTATEASSVAGAGPTSWDADLHRSFVDARLELDVVLDVIDRLQAKVGVGLAKIEAPRKSSGSAVSELNSSARTKKRALSEAQELLTQGAAALARRSS